VRVQQDRATLRSGFIVEVRSAGSPLPRWGAMKRGARLLASCQAEPHDRERRHYSLVSNLVDGIAAHFSLARTTRGHVIARSRATAQSGGEDGPSLAGGFVLGAEAPRADVDFSLPSLYHNRSPLDIRQPLPQGVLFGMAYTTSEGSPFSANFALHRNISFCLNFGNHSITISPGERAP
jgi:hypothetical protein